MNLPAIKVEGNVGHGLHTSTNNNVVLTKADRLGAKHNSLHTTGTDLVNSSASYRGGETSSKGSLSGRSLALTSLENVSKQKFIYLVRCNF